jgi:ATP-dependent helicase HrpA
MRLSTILKLIPRIQPAEILQNIPSGSFTPEDDLAILENALSNLLKLCRLAKRRKQLGFLALHTDGQGKYWFQGTRNYLTALKESLYSLEALADEQNGSGGEINRAYRELAEELESL